MAKVLGESIIPVLKQKIDAKQDKLVSGVNIKTVNGESVLGSGNIEVAKLYTGTGDATDGAMTQKAVTDKFTEIEGKISAKDAQVEAIEEILEGTVQTDTKLAEASESTVTLIKSKAALNDLDNETDTNIALPVASATQAGVINASTYQTIQETKEKVEAIEGAAVAVEGLSASADKDELDAAYKEESGKDTIPNGAKILDIDNNKTWTYYENTDEWYSQDNNNPTIEIDVFTNSKAGIIKGADVEGKVFAETDGTGSVKGWDALKAQSDSNKSDIEGINTTIAGLDDKYTSKEDGDSLRSDLEDALGEIATLEADKQDKLVGTGEGQNLKTINSESLVGAGNVTVQEVLVSGTNIKTVNGSSILGNGDLSIDVPEEMTAEEFEAIWNSSDED